MTCNTTLFLIMRPSFNFMMNLLFIFSYKAVENKDKSAPVSMSANALVCPMFISHTLAPIATAPSASPES